MGGNSRWEIVMNEENTKKLFEDFPILYRDRDKPRNVTRICDGFACSDGWFDIIYNLSKKISEECPRVKAFQVKEKLGTLSFYAGCIQKNKLDKIYDLISLAEKESSETCELCGSKEGTKVKTSEGSFYIRALCRKCREKDENRRRNK
jgi:hypothetical protein